MRRERSPRKYWHEKLLRRADQAAVAALVLFAVVGIGIYWLTAGGASGRLIEIDRAPRHPAAFIVDINQADWPEIAQLPGIGEALARRIVESRETEGPFVDLDHLERVRGIGPKTLDRVRPYLRPLADTSNVAGP